MREYLIHILGGFTEKEYNALYQALTVYKREVYNISEQLRVALKNDNRDPKTGRYVKK